MKNNILRVFLLGTALSLLGLSGCLNSEEPFDAAKQFEEDQEALTDYIQSKGYSNVQTDTAGTEMRYVINPQGTGESPVGGDWLYVNYSGNLLNGTVFDEQDSVYIQLSQRLIAGWRVLMPYLKEGGEMVMFIPSYYGYGQASVGSIPANSPLIFEVKLHEVHDQFGYEQKRIDEYIEEKGLTVETDTVEGLKYIINPEGSGEYVKATDRISVDYDVRYVLDEEEKIILQANEVTVQLDTYSVEGWKILLPYAKAGSTITMFIPSEFAYGSNGSASIDGNTPLKYTVTINSIVN